MAKLNYAKAARQYKAEHYGEQIKQKVSRWQKVKQKAKRRAWNKKNPKAAKVRKYYAVVDSERQSGRYWQWRKSILKRDKFHCQSCGSQSNLHAHHVKEWHDYPEYRYRVDNGLTLCRDCHILIHPFLDYKRHKELQALVKTPKPCKIIRRPAV